MSKKIRIDKLLAHMGLGTRSEIKKAVKFGKVTLAGKVIKDSGIIVDQDTSEVAFEGVPVIYRDIVYFMLNKPQGVISATEDGRERTVIDLLEPQDRLREPFPVGRLDKDTVGLLLLTNDGQLAHELLSPRKHVAKTYEAIVHGNVGETDKEQFSIGVTLDDGYVTLPAVLEMIGQEEREEGTFSSISLTIMEGKFHQVKRMFEAVGKTVVFLKRVSMGPLALDESLPEGSYRELTFEEVELLRAHKRKSEQ
jgi:16S rRNA pseudouridine516 synthase